LQAEEESLYGHLSNSPRYYFRNVRNTPVSWFPVYFRSAAKKTFSLTIVATFRPPLNFSKVVYAICLHTFLQDMPTRPRRPEPNNQMAAGSGISPGGMRLLPGVGK
jgi:hypothetical protein